MTSLTEADVEQVALDLLSGLGWGWRTGLTSHRIYRMPSAETTARWSWNAG